MLSRQLHFRTGNQNPESVFKQAVKLQQGAQNVFSDQRILSTKYGAGCMQAHLQKFAHVVQKPFAEICARGRKCRLEFFSKMEKSWKNPKMAEHAILIIIKSSHMKFQEVVRKLHVLIIQDHFSNLICVLKSF